ncbi:MAG: DUF2723 domain-containing protein [Gemmatimonadetes bacterium]|nr:DUF2723 domain-containing protein [Gemmatimonadota bacterium]
MSQAARETRPTDTRRTATPPPIHHSPPYGLALIAGLAVFLLYAITLAPSTAFWDASEYIATARILGIPHPPGNPLFVLMAGAWERILAPTGLSTAVRVNLFSALMTAAASVCWFLVVHRILAFFTGNEMVRRLGAAAAVLLSATAFTVWNHSNVNEKVYTISLFTIALLSWLAFLWRDHIEEHRVGEQKGWHDDNLLILMVFVLALSVGNHLMAFLAAPALVLFIALVKPQVFLNWRIYAWGAVFAVIGLTVHLYLPLRAGLNPIINEAAPTCASVSDALISIITFGGAGCEDLSASLAREQYAKPPVTERMAPIWAQIANYFQYFDWQWSRSVQGASGYYAAGRVPFTVLFFVLGVYGAWRHWLRDRISFVYIATLFATLSLGLVFYLNFRYGYNQVGALGLPFDSAEVRERDYFFIVSFSMWGLWAGIGLTALWLRAQESLRNRPRAVLSTSPILVLALIPLVLNWPYASRAGDYSARDWAHNLLQSVEPYGVLYTNGDNDTFPLWYLQEVEGIRRDVTVIVWSYLNTPWYAKQIRDLTQPCERPEQWREDPTRIICQRSFEADRAPDFYAGLATPPTRSILPLPDAQIDAATMGAVQLPQDVVFEARGVQTVIPAGTVLAPADQFILLTIREAWGDRPIYFAGTTNTHRKLGLDRFVARQGVAYKLIDPAEAAGLVQMPQNLPISPVFGAYLDVERTEQLLHNVFVHRDLIDRSHWPDDATRGIPTYYGYAHYSLAQARSMQGDEAAADRNIGIADRWMMLSER